MGVAPLKYIIGISLPFNHSSALISRTGMTGVRSFYTVAGLEYVEVTAGYMA
jgi:hypothetical protein